MQPNSTYIVEVRGVDEDGQVGPWSAQFSFETVVDEMPPADVTGLTAVNDGSNFIAEWNAVTTNADGSALEDLRDYLVTVTAGAEEAKFGTPDTKFFFDYVRNKNSFTSPQPSVTFNVQARDRVGNLSNSVTASATKPVPDAPVLAATAKRNGVELIWTAVEDDLDRYEIWKNGAYYASVGQGTLIYTDTDVGAGSQAYVVRAYDRFEQYGASNQVLEAEVALDLQADLIAPKPPTAATYTDSAIAGTADSLAVLGWSAPVQDTDDTSYTDQEMFEIRYRTDPARAWQFVSVPDDRLDGSTPQDFEYELTVPQGETLYWSVRAVDRAGNNSTWLESTNDIVLDDSPPEQPFLPSVAGNTMTLQVTHNLLDAVSASLGPNVTDMDIYVGTTDVYGNMTRATRVPVATLIAMGLPLVVSLPYPVTESSVDRFVRVVAVSRAGVESVPSAAAPVTIELVQSINIEDATITDAKIANLSASKLTAGSAFISNLLVQSTLSVSPGGLIKSDNYDFSTRTGWAVDDGNLYLFDGEIDASLVTVQDEANLVDYGFSMFSYIGYWYDEYMHTSDADIIASITSVWSRYGKNALRVQTLAAGTKQVWLFPDPAVV